MDESRWPQGLRKFIDQIGHQAESLVLEVAYVEPIWHIEVTCPCCHLTRYWNVMAGPPLPDPEAMAVPSAFQEMFG